MVRGESIGAPACPRDDYPLSAWDGFLGVGLDEMSSYSGFGVALRIAPGTELSFQIIENTFHAITVWRIACFGCLFYSNLAANWFRFVLKAIIRANFGMTHRGHLLKPLHEIVNYCA